jgi:ketosteroid isomerase-like protein
MNDLQTAVDKLLGAYGSAVFAKEVDAFMSLYDPQARVFDAWGVWSYEGAPAWRQAVEGWFTSLGTERVKVAFEDVQSAGSRDLALVSAIVTYAGVSAQGEPLRRLQNRLTWALRTSAHNLRIVHEHTSAPIDFNDSKAMLERQGRS